MKRHAVKHAGRVLQAVGGACAEHWRSVAVWPGEWVPGGVMGMMSKNHSALQLDSQFLHLIDSALWTLWQDPVQKLEDTKWFSPYILHWMIIFAGSYNRLGLWTGCCWMSVSFSLWSTLDSVLAHVIQILWKDSETVFLQGLRLLFGTFLKKPWHEPVSDFFLHPGPFRNL